MVSNFGTSWTTFWHHVWTNFGANFGPIWVPTLVQFWCQLWSNLNDIFFWLLPGRRFLFFLVSNDIIFPRQDATFWDFVTKSGRAVKKCEILIANFGPILMPTLVRFECQLWSDLSANFGQIWVPILVQVEHRLSRILASPWLTLSLLASLAGIIYFRYMYP